MYPQGKLLPVSEHLITLSRQTNSSKVHRSKVCNPLRRNAYIIFMEIIGVSQTCDLSVALLKRLIREQKRPLTGCRSCRALEISYPWGKSHIMSLPYVTL